MTNGNGDGSGGPLKTASALVGLLAGVVGVIYVAGGLVLALRLYFDHFQQDEVVSAVAQLPRETVVTAALLGVFALAAVVGLVATLFSGLLRRPRPRGTRSAGRTAGLVAFFLLFPLVVSLPALVHAIGQEETSQGLRVYFIGAAVTACLLIGGWHLLGEIGGRVGWSLGVKAAASGAVWAAIALIPVVMFAGTHSFVTAQVCTTGAELPAKAKLIGESSDRIFLEEEFGNEAAILELPSGQVTRSEYGDLSSRFTCPLPARKKVTARVAEFDLKGHGSSTEQEIATRLRPRLRFDGEEPWRPISVPAFLGERFEGGGAHLLCDRKAIGSCERLSSSDQLAREAGEPGYIDIHGKAGGGVDYEAADSSCLERLPRTTVVDCNSGHGAAMYYRRTTHEGRWYWDYWWFYRYNDYAGFGDTCDSFFCGDHEGDWEGITVVTTASARPEILAALYAAHGERVLVDGKDLPRAGNHPLVFVARGTHASYPYRCPGNCREYTRKGGERLPETHHDGAVPWGSNSDTQCARNTCVRPLPEVGRPGPRALPLAGGWAGWPGNWGNTCYGGCKHVVIGEPSPRSPGAQPRFRCPWAATKVALPNADDTGLSRSEPAGDAERLYAYCVAQRGGL